MSEMLKSWTWMHKNIRCFFVNVFLGNISSRNRYHKHDIYNLIKWLVYRCISDSCIFLKYFLHSWHCIALNIISTWKIMLMSCCKCHVCDNSFKMKCYIRNHLQKSPGYFLVPHSRYQHFRYISQNAKPQEITNESSSPIPPKKS